MKPLPKFLIEFGPLLAFFIGNWKGGVFWGTGIFMVAIAIALLASWILTKKIAKVPLLSAIFVGIFGGLTIWLHDDTFIKVKVTLINVFFGAMLWAGSISQVFIKYVVGEAINLPQEACVCLPCAGGFSSYVWLSSTN
jgi:intracellular septation protein